MRKILARAIIAAGLFSVTAAHAIYPTVPGFYLGFQGGFSQANYTEESLNATSARIDSGGLAGRVYGGYQVNPYFSGEIGYTYFANTSISSLYAYTVQNGDGDIGLQAVDGVIKGTVNLSDSGFNIFGKLGAAVVFSNVSSVVSTGTFLTNQTNTLFAYGGGVSYNIFPNLPIEVAYMGLQAAGSIPNVFLATLGVAYYFG